MALGHFLTIPEVARILGRDASTARQWIAKGTWPEELPIHEWTGRRLVRRVDVEAFSGAPLEEAS